MQSGRSLVNDLFLAPDDGGDTPSPPQILAAVRAIPIPVALFGRDGGCIGSSAAFDALAGEHPGSLEAALCALGRLAPHDDAAVGRLRQLAEAPRPEVVTLRPSAQRALHVELSGGGTDATTLVCRDVAVEPAPCQLMEEFPIGLVLFDEDGRIAGLNAAFRALYGLGSAGDRWIRRSFEDLLRDCVARGVFPDAAEDAEAWLEARLSMHARPEAIVEERLSDGRWCRAIGRRLSTGGRIGVRIDVTETRSAEARLRAALDEAAQATRAKTAFLANMSHEIRTPMNGVIGMAELLAETELDGEQEFLVETIRNSGEALLSIINDILDYSKIEADKLELAEEEFDLERTVLDVLNIMAARATQKGLDLALDYDLFLPARFRGDGARIRQVLTNLVGNAVKFTEQGHVLVRVIGAPSGDPSRYRLHIVVEDTGIGIPKDRIEHIFAEFGQADTSVTRKFGGTGLGLAISKRLVEIMGGEIWVESEPGAGAAFGIRLDLPAAPPMPESPRTKATRGSAMVVDDQPTNLDIISRHLSRLGFEVTTASDADTCLAAIKAGARPDVVLTDHQMPGMDGVALARALRAAGLGAPIVLLTSLSPSTGAELPADLFASVLRKPIRREQLLDSLLQLTRGALPQGPAPAAKPVPPAPAPVAEGACTILAAEDNRTNRMVLERMLRNSGFRLELAVNGCEAVEKFAEIRPEIVLMDISMPEMDGLEAMRRIRSIQREQGLPHTPIIALTAHAFDAEFQRFLSAGFDACLSKPVKKAELLSLLHAHAHAGDGG